MAQGTGIQWTDATWNPVAGCSLVSPGCTNCYAMKMAARLESMGQPKYQGLTKKVNGNAVWTGKINLDEKALMRPLSWKKPSRVFVNSMSDLFHEAVPFEFVDKVFAVMALCPQHTFQVLTKRPERMAEYLNAEGVSGRVSNAPWSMPLPSHLAGRFRIEDPNPELLRLTAQTLAIVDPDGSKAAAIRAKRPKTWPIHSVWLGTSCEDQQRADERIDRLRKCTSAIRFLSLEPLIGRINPLNLEGIHWVIVGGESGPRSRPCAIEWIESIINQCLGAGVACFVKQLGATSVRAGHHRGGVPVEWYPSLKLADSHGGDPDEWPEHLRVREFPEVVNA